MAQRESRPLFQSHWATILALGAFSLAVHVVVNVVGGYGYFRDELYYIACSKHLAAGYVDHPPFSILIMALTRLSLGESLFAIRLVPALASAVSVVVICLIVRRLRGGAAAMALGSACFLAAPQLLGFHAYYSMNSLDILLWLLAAYMLTGLIVMPGTRGWIGLGVVLGLGLLNKTSVLWLGAGVGAATVLTDLRRQLRRPGPYLAGAIAVIIFSPYIIWNALNGWPHLEFMRNATALKYSSLTRTNFLIDQFWGMNPFTFFVSLPGLWWCLFHSEGRRYRALGVSFLAVLTILLANPHTKAEYVAAAYPALFATGGVALGRLSPRLRSIVVTTLLSCLVLSGILLAPFAMPILPVERHIRYSRALGVAPSTPENKDLAELGQFFADMHGWEELARSVSEVYQEIPDTERPTAVIFANNYGEAGALELYASRYPLPRVICCHNAYWFWGPGSTPITTFLLLGGSREDYVGTYREVTLGAEHRCRYCMPYENNLGIFVARGRSAPIEELWTVCRHFE